MACALRLPSEKKGDAGLYKVRGTRYILRVAPIDGGNDDKSPRRGWRGRKARFNGGLFAFLVHGGHALSASISPAVSRASTVSSSACRKKSRAASKCSAALRHEGMSSGGLRATSAARLMCSASCCAVE